MAILFNSFFFKVFFLLKKKKKRILGFTFYRSWERLWDNQELRDHHGAFQDFYESLSDTFKILRGFLKDVECYELSFIHTTWCLRRDSKPKPCRSISNWDSGKYLFLMNNSENGNGRTGVISGDHCVTLPIDGGHFIFPVDLHFILANRQAPIPDDCINRHVVIRSDVADANDWSAANLNRRPCNFSLSLWLILQFFKNLFELLSKLLPALSNIFIMSSSSTSKTPKVFSYQIETPWIMDRSSRSKSITYCFLKCSKMAGGGGGFTIAYVSIPQFQ